MRLSARVLDRSLPVKRDRYGMETLLIAKIREEHPDWNMKTFSVIPSHKCVIYSSGAFTMCLYLSISWSKTLLK